MSPELLLAVAAIISALGQCYSQLTNTKQTRKLVEHLVRRVDRIDEGLGLPPMPLEETDEHD